MGPLARPLVQLSTPLWYSKVAMARIRSRPKVLITGFHGSSLTPISAAVSYSWMQDENKNPRRENYMSQRVFKASGGIINGGYYNSNSYDAVNVPTQHIHNPDAGSTWFQNMLDPDSQDMARFLALTNPSRPEVLLPAFIGELRDLPKLVKYGAELGKALFDAGKGISGAASRGTGALAEELVSHVRPTQGNGLSKTKQLGAANLALQFGVMPFIGDIGRMISLHDAIEHRKKELKRLYDGRGLKRSMELDARVKVDKYMVNPRTLYPGGLVELTETRKARRWATVRYKPNGQLPPMIPSDGEIRKMLLGLNLHNIATTAWELMPWSWCADYFGNIGDILAAGNNHLQTSFTGSMMTEFSYHKTLPTTSWKYLDRGGWAMSGMDSLAKSFTRMPLGGILPSFGIPILGSRQLSILASIYATRAYR